MGIYTTYKCPKCRRGLEYLVPYKSRGVGEPFRECPKCQTIVNVSELLNEWELMNEEERSGMRTRVVWTAGQVGGLWGFIAGFMSAGYLFEEQLGDDWLLPAMLGGLVGALIGFLIHRPIVARQLDRQIAASAARMEQPNYRQKLAALGFLQRP